MQDQMMVNPVQEILRLKFSQKKKSQVCVFIYVFMNLLTEIVMYTHTYTNMHTDMQTFLILLFR